MENYNIIRDLIYSFSAMGTKLVSQTGATLIGHAPFIAPEAWLNCLYSPIKEEEIKRIEDSLQRPIPKVYKDFLMCFSNGLNILCDTFCLFGYRRNYARNIFDVWQPYSIIEQNIFENPFDSIFIIGGYDWDGSIIYINESEEICYSSSEDETPLLKWDSLIQMLESEIRRLYTLCDDSGKFLDSNKPTIPINKKQI